MLKRKESLNFYALLIRQSEVIRDAVDALCRFCENPTQENGDFVKSESGELLNLLFSFGRERYAIAAVNHFDDRFYFLLDAQVAPYN